MIARISKGGRSFMGAFMYFGHDKKQTTKERVEASYVGNMLTRDPDKAWKVMAYTALSQDRLKEASGQKKTGRKLELPVFNYALAWHPDETPTLEQKFEAGRKSLEALGLSEYEFVIDVHRDAPQSHIHVTVNRVHPITGLAAKLSNSKKTISAFCHAYEVEHGKIYCKLREENIQKRKEGEMTRYADPHIVKAWNEAADGKAFIEALKKEGYNLAQGRKRVVVVDKYGKIFNPARQLPGVKAKDIKAKLGTLNLRTLFDAASLSRQIQKKQQKKYDERQKAVAKAPSPAAPAAERKPSLPPPEAQNRLQNRHLEERAKHFSHYQTLIEKEQERLHDHYRIKDRQNAIKVLSEKTTNPSWWRKIRGHARADLLELRDMKRSYRNVQGRIDEQLGFWEKERERTLKSLTDRHTNEKAWLFDKAAEFQPVKTIPNVARTKARDLDHDR